MLEKPQQVAVVGSGLAGLTTARLLADDAQHRYEVHIYEIVSLPHLLKVSSPPLTQLTYIFRHPNPPSPPPLSTLLHPPV
jgi:flavin-dependent dehydrogenase